MLPGTPLWDHTIPGLVLLAVNGLGMIAVSVGVQALPIGHRRILRPVMFVTGVPMVGTVVGTAILASRSSLGPAKKAP